MRLICCTAGLHCIPTSTVELNFRVLYVLTLLIIARSSFVQLKTCKLSDENEELVKRSLLQAINAAEPDTGKVNFHGIFCKGSLAVGQ